MDGLGDSRSESSSVLYIGNLDRRVTEAIILDILDVAKGSNLPQIQDKILSCKMVTPTDAPDCAPYCFVTFADEASAKAAMTFFNGREIFGKIVKVNWAAPTAGNKVTGGNYSVFIGDLEESVDDETLRKAFQPFGEIVNVRVVRDMDSAVSKGYGFVSFKRKNEAEEAIQKMNGQMIGTKNIRTNWATRNKGPPQSAQDQLNYNDVYQKASLSNCTVYVGGLAEGISDDIIRQHFSCYGDIADTKLFPDKGYAFIKFLSHNSAATAIVKSHGRDLMGCSIKCWWGKEAHDSVNNSNVPGIMQPHQQQQQQQQYAMPYNPYYYPQYWATIPQQQQQQGHGGMLSANGSQSGHMPPQGYMPPGYNVMPMYQSAGAYGQVPVYGGHMNNQQQTPQQPGPYTNSVYQNTH